MTPDDPRHGRYAGAAAHWKNGEPPCDLCKPVAFQVRKRNRHLRAIGRPAHVPSLGTVRRLEALRALGWSIIAISRESGVSEKTLRNPSYRGTTVHRNTAEAVAAAYDRLHMTVPDGPYAGRERRAAARHGFAPPLAWNDIDDPNEVPNVGGRDEEIDEIVVQRLLWLDSTVKSTRAEKVEAMARWLTMGRKEHELCAAHGWKEARYTPRAVQRQAS